MRTGLKRAGLESLVNVMEAIGAIQETGRFRIFLVRGVRIGLR